MYICVRVDCETPDVWSFFIEEDASSMDAGYETLTDWLTDWLTFLPPFFAAIVSEDSARVTTPRRDETGTGATASGKTDTAHEKQQQHESQNTWWWRNLHVPGTKNRTRNENKKIVKNDRSTTVKGIPQIWPFNDRWKGGVEKIRSFNDRKKDRSTIGEKRIVQRLEKRDR